MRSPPCDSTTASNRSTAESRSARSSALSPPVTAPPRRRNRSATAAATQHEQREACQQHPQRHRNHDVQERQGWIHEGEHAEGDADHTLNQQDPPPVEYGPHAYGGSHRDNAINQGVRGNKRGQCDDRGARPHQDEHPEYDSGDASQQEKPPVVADGGVDLRGTAYGVLLSG